ncbi:translation initiation factor IF-2 [Rhabdochlamydiaceae symbiont of Dictyostelium giganteum]|uniref:translation initiation factor IF-2 n=1 Tax=Rhabdochlamydiaceae symbiont of Dictyostelium giganteum TaxID=3342349 RepID=UPI00384CDD19
MAKNLKITVKNAQLAEALKKFNKSEPTEPQKTGAKPAQEGSLAPAIDPVIPAAPQPKPEPKVVKPLANSQPHAQLLPPIVKKPAPVKESQEAIKEAPAQSVPTQPVLGPKYTEANPRPLGPKFSTPQRGFSKEPSDVDGNTYSSEERPRYSKPAYTPRQDQSSSSGRQTHPSSYQPRQGNVSSDRVRSSSYTPRQPSSYTPRSEQSSSDASRPANGPYIPRQSGHSSDSSRPSHPSSYQQRQGNAPSDRPRPAYTPRTGGYSSDGPKTGGYSSDRPRQSGYSSDSPRSANPAYPPRQSGYSSDAARPPYTPRTSGYSSDRPRAPYTPRTGGYSSGASGPRFGQGTSQRPYTPRSNAPSSGFTPRPGMGSGSPVRRGPYTPGAPRFGLTPIPKNLPTSRPPRIDDPKHKTLLKDKDKANKKPELERGFDSRDRQGLRDENDEGWRRRKGRSFKSRYLDAEEVIRPKHLSIRLPISIKDLASEMKLKASQLLSNLFMKGVVLTLNDYLDDETTIQLLGSDFECDITIDTSEEKRLQITDQTIKQEIAQTPDEELIYRSPVVTFMGHVDHGKTSLIDAIRKTNVVAHEAGAITQHIGAFKCHTSQGDLTILDTPGHEAFSAMRSRGTEVTDIVVLVIAGDEGIKTQTVEAIEQAQLANVPIVVAINKCDKPSFDPETIYRQLAEKNLLPEAWGGQTITINCSAVTGEGIITLLEMLALQAEILELKANPNTRARGSVIESEMHKGLGSVTTVLVQNGTLHIGDAIVFADHWGRVKTMHNEHDQLIESAPPSTPVKITGLSGLPEAGSDFIVVKNEKEAREVSEKRAIQKKHTALQAKRGGLENLLSQQIQKQEKKVLPLMLRADVQGSLEALKHSLMKIVSSKVEVNIVSAAVGEISESDIQLASAMKCTILGFHTPIESHAEPLIKALGVQVKLHDIIYHAVDDVKELMIGLLDKVAQENAIGQAVIKAVFKSSQIGNIAGSQVSEGTIKRGCQVKLMRNQQMIWQGTLASLKKVKEDVKEMSKGHECGILLQGFNDFKEGDILEAYEITYFTPDL